MNLLHDIWPKNEKTTHKSVPKKIQLNKFPHIHFSNMDVLFNMKSIVLEIKQIFSCLGRSKCWIVCSVIRQLNLLLHLRGLLSPNWIKLIFALYFNITVLNFVSPSLKSIVVNNPLKKIPFLTKTMLQMKKQEQMVTFERIWWKKADFFRPRPIIPRRVTPPGPAARRLHQEIFPRRGFGRARFVSWLFVRALVRLAAFCLQSWLGLGEKQKQKGVFFFPRAAAAPSSLRLSPLRLRQQLLCHFSWSIALFSNPRTEKFQLAWRWWMGWK
jgi:hypothetical protein